MKTEITITTACERETEKAGRLAAQALGASDTVGICGKLGAGKTVIARGIARGLGIEENITSPTFVIMNRYRCEGHRSVYFHHFDLYRNPSAEEFEELGFGEILRGANICAIEWAGKIPGILKKISVRIDISFSEKGENFREIKITASQEKIAQLAKQLQKNFKLK